MISFGKVSASSSIAATQLVDRVKNGEQSAFAELYDKYAGAIYGVTLKIVRSEEAAEDVLQDAFVKIWKNIHAYDSTRGTIFTWMLNVARNTAIDRLRKMKNLDKAKIQTQEQHVNNPDGNRSSQNTNTIGLIDEVEKLKPEHRILVEYIYFNGYTQQEVADELDMPLGTVKTRIRSAVGELRKIFATLFFWI